jgi:hypothetical protein
MHWIIYLIIFVIAFSIKDGIRKRSLNKFDNMAVLSLEFSATFLIFLVIALFTKVPLPINSYTLTFLGIGLLHGLGTVGKINAMNISLSKTTLTSKYDIFFPMLLGFFFLGESSLLGFSSTVGILKIIALSLLPLSIYLLQNKKQDKNDKTSIIWFWSMIQFFIFHATLDFLIKLNINPGLIVQALVFQRLGAGAITLGAALISRAKFPLQKQLFGVTAANAILISIAHFSTISALTTAPLVIYKPLAKMLTVIFITLIGLFVFGEHKKITKRNKWGYLVTGLGVILLIISEVIELS